MITVHHLANSRSQRILWLLEELDLPYDVKRYERQPTQLAPDSLKSIHPLGKSPIITDGDQTIAESGAIVSYLIDTYGAGRLIPTAGTPERQHYTYWLHYAEGSAMPPLVMKTLFSAIPNAPAMPFLLRPLARAMFGGITKSYLDPQIATHIALWDEALAKSPYFAGNALTGADIMMSFPLQATAPQLPERLGIYLHTLESRPAYQRALTRGGPYTIG